MSVEDALRIVVSASRPVQDIEEVDLDAVVGRVLAETVLAPSDMPRLDRSAMDGYAVRSQDLGAVPVELNVTGFIPAGRPVGASRVDSHQAVRIMTGAPLPPGADAVQMVEKTEVLESGARVRILESLRPGENVFHRGQDVTKGAVLLHEGAWLRAAEVGVLAAAGKVRVRVRRLPSAGLLSTGDEIVDPDREPDDHQIRNSNGPMLAAALRTQGLTPRVIGVARDDAKDLDEKIAEGLRGDIFLLIGGVSVGDRDLVAERLEAAGVETLFHRVAMKPGKPLLFGRRGGCLVFGLPGNPLSSLAAFLLFVLPALRAMRGLEPVGLPDVMARLESPLQQKTGRAWFRLARISVREGILHAKPVESSGSGDLVSAARANGFIRMPAETSRLDAGDTVRVLLWPGFEVSAHPLG